MKRIAVLTSGGDAPGMNAALRTIVKVCAGRGVDVLGVEDGYDGLIDARFRPLTRSQAGQLVSDAELSWAGNQGGTLLGSARCKRFYQPEGRARAVTALSEARVDGLIVIGGNGSLTGAHLMARTTSTPVVGIPASIDNDIGCTSTALGTDSALNTIVSACDRISDTARSHRRAFIVEVMGRASGYLAMAAAVAAGADGILFREQGRDEDELVSTVERCIRAGFSGGERRRVLILKAEGVEIPCTRLVRLVQERLADHVPELEVRATVLGHLVRGGNPSYSDRMLAGRLGFAAVDAIADGVSDQMVAWLPQQVEGGIPTKDPAVQRFPLERVLEETQALLDGSSAVTRWRVKMLEALEGTLGL